MLAAHGTRCPTMHEIDKILSLTNLKEQIVKNHEERRGKTTFFLLFLSIPRLYSLLFIHLILTTYVKC